MPQERKIELFLDGQPAGQLFAKCAFLPAGKLSFVCEGGRGLRETSAAGRMDPYVIFKADGQVTADCFVRWGGFEIFPPFGAGHPTQLSAIGPWVTELGDRVLAREGKSCDRLLLCKGTGVACRKLFWGSCSAGSA